ncbi:MAG: phosphoribosylamine--glycine ligase [Abditibacteriota bacterium]|nr:phosphoribosylamine--glycine ligase [Abditibacteriota bacterium]
MKVLIIGSGGRECAMAELCSRSPLLTALYSLPGNAGMEKYSTRIRGVKPTDTEAVAAKAAELGADLVICGPESPLIKGLADVLEAKGIPVFGCSKSAARMEGSKRFAKELMQKYDIPTAACRVFTRSEEAARYIDETASRSGDPIVVKADGEAAGKGVFVCPDPEDAKKAAADMLDKGIFGDSGKEVIIEEYLDGPEVTVLSFVDGEKFAVMPPSQDHKRAFDGDRGPNTGGMGVYSPVPAYTREISDFVNEHIIRATLKALATEGIYYKGVLYTGLALTSKGPRVVEFNVRFGDPETQVILPLMTSDFLEVCYKTALGRLEEADISFADKKAVSVVIASGGYPGSYRKGLPITGVEEAAGTARVYHAGTEFIDGVLCTSGGRVLNVTCLGDSFDKCIKDVYEAVDKIKFEDCFCRRDIAWRVR